jgi:hypothetical protein
MSALSGKNENRDKDLLLGKKTSAISEEYAGKYHCLFNNFFLK